MWILPDHSKFSAFAQDMAGSSLDLSEQGCVLAQSLMWRSKPSPSATWLRRLKKESWLQHLSTRILKPSRTERFVAKWTASLEDIPASRSQPQESDLEKKTQDTSGLSLQTAFAFADPDGASLKTLKDTLPAGCITSSQNWQEWVTEQRGEYSQRVKLAHRTNGSGSISWPTCAARDYKGTYTENSMTRKDGKDRSMDTLPQAVETVKTWPTPTVQEAGKIGNKANYGQKALSNHPAIVGLPDREKLNKSGNRQGCAEQWATPQARDNKGAQGRSYLGHNKDLPMQTEGIRSQATGKLNPRWVETLMGLPIGWVSPEPVRHTTCTNRTDELRMLGNGVVPQTAAKAFTILAERLQ